MQPQGRRPSSPACFLLCVKGFCRPRGAAVRRKCDHAGDIPDGTQRAPCPRGHSRGHAASTLSTGQVLSPAGSGTGIAASDIKGCFGHSGEKGWWPVCSWGRPPRVSQKTESWTLCHVSDRTANLKCFQVLCRPDRTRAGAPAVSLQFGLPFLYLGTLDLFMSHKPCPRPPPMLRAEVSAADEGDRAAGTRNGHSSGLASL